MTHLRVRDIGIDRMLIRVETPLGDARIACQAADPERHKPN